MNYYFILTNGTCYRTTKYTSAYKFLQNNLLNVVETNFVYI